MGAMYDPLAGTAVAVWVIDNHKQTTATANVQEQLEADRENCINQLILPGYPRPVVYELCGRNRYGVPFLYGWYAKRSHAEYWIPSIEETYQPMEINLRTIYPDPIPLPPRRPTAYKSTPRQRKLI